jgi:hypothetical protein
MLFEPCACTFRCTQTQHQILCFCTAQLLHLKFGCCWLRAYFASQFRPMLSRGSDENPSGMDAISPILHGGRDMESQALLATSEIPSSPGQGPLGRPGRPRRRCNARVAEGAVLLFLVNIIWVASSEVVQVGGPSSACSFLLSLITTFSPRSSTFTTTWTSTNHFS